MPFLNRCEGGIGGDNNLINKQLRFRNFISNKYPSYLNDMTLIDKYDIVMLDITSTYYEKWSLEELDNLIEGFIIMGNNYIGKKCIKGFIELHNKNDDIDSDSD